MRTTRLTALLFSLPLASLLLTAPLLADDLVTGTSVDSTLLDDEQSFFGESDSPQPDTPSQVQWQPAGQFGIGLPPQVQTQDQDDPAMKYWADSRGQSFYNRNKRSTGSGSRGSSYRSSSASTFDSRDRRSSNNYYLPQKQQNDGRFQNYYYPDKTTTDDQYDLYENYQYYPGEYERNYMSLYWGGRPQYYPSRQILSTGGTPYNRTVGPIGHGYYRIR